MIKYLIIFILLSIIPVYAQQQQASPAEAALQISSTANAMAQAIMQQGKTIEQLQKENTELKKKLEDKNNVGQNPK